MRIYIGFDDTDNIDADRGTGKLARLFEGELPLGCRVEGVVRQQLMMDERIPYTSHNSSACVIVDVPDASLVDSIIERASEHIERHSLDGSDPGLCVAYGSNGELTDLMTFGSLCTARVVSQREALKAAYGHHLSGHGGTNDGIIGAAASVGLTASGWSGRFIEYGNLRAFTDPVTVRDLEKSNIIVVSSDRDARVPAPEDLVFTKGWLRPRLWGGRAVLLVAPKKEGSWESLGEKRNKGRN